MSVPPVDVPRELRALRRFYDATASRLSDADDAALFQSASAVSDWSPAEHLYHIWRANASMLKAARVLASGTMDGKTPDLTPAGVQTLTEGTIPRGVGTAPKAMRPPDGLDRAALRDVLTRSRDKLDALSAVADVLPDAAGALPHPFWGALTATQWVRAARIHSDHHQAILDDIDAALAEG